MGFDRIIALDLGKFNSVNCNMDAHTRQHTFAAVATTPQALHDLLIARSAAGAEPARTLVVFETCDAAGWVYDLAVALGFQVKVANCCLTVKGFSPRKTPRPHRRCLLARELLSHQSPLTSPRS
jgi:hypothetical protein